MVFCLRFGGYVRFHHFIILPFGFVCCSDGQCLPLPPVIGFACHYHAHLNFLFILVGRFLVVDLFVCSHMLLTCFPWMIVVGLGRFCQVDLPFKFEAVRSSSWLRLPA